MLRKVFAKTFFCLFLTQKIFCKEQKMLFSLMHWLHPNSFSCVMNWAWLLYFWSAWTILFLCFNFLISIFFLHFICCNYTHFSRILFTFCSWLIVGKALFIMVILLTTMSTIQTLLLRIVGYTFAIFKTFLITMSVFNKAIYKPPHD